MKAMYGSSTFRAEQWFVRVKAGDRPLLFNNWHRTGLRKVAERLVNHMVQSSASFLSKGPAADNAMDRLAWAEEEIAALDRHSRHKNIHSEALTSVYDCRVLIIERHNRDFPADKRSSADSELRDQIGGKPDVARIAKAEACAANGGIIE
jgi:hypothetical protein